ncbi:MAG: extracellular solute-binding protein [Caldilinea sp. CFX5]|nr:extracellular solute-binding protein [Caldilinea sp. CFX5]
MSANPQNPYRLSRRHFMAGTTIISASALLAACVPAAPGGQPAAGDAPASSEAAWLTEPDVAKLPQTTLRYWYFETPERIELGKQQEAAFEAMHPNIQIEGSTAPDAVDNEMLVAFIKAGTNSHVHQSVNMEDTWYFSRDLLLPLQDLPGFQEVMDKMNPKLNYTWKDGNVYSISWYSGPRVMFYNGQRVREAGLDPEKLPETYSQYLEWAKALTDDTHWFTNLWTQEEWWRWQFQAYAFYIAATGTNQLVSEDGAKAIFNTPEALQSYELIHTLFAEKYNLTETLEGNPFLSGQVAATLSGAGLMGTVKREAPEGFELLVGPIPKPDDSTVEGFPTYNFVRNFAIMREQALEGGAADQVNRAAWEFMKYLLSDEQLAADFAITGDLPPTKDVLTNPLFTQVLQGLPAGEKYATFAENSYIYDMNTTLGSEIMGVLTKSYVDMIFDAKTPDQALADAETEVNDLLAKQ